MADENVNEDAKTPKRLGEGRRDAEARTPPTKP